MKILVLCGDKWHRAQTARDGLKPLEAAGFTFDFIEDMSAGLPDDLIPYPAIILTKINHISPTNEQPWMTPASASVLCRYVQEGGGLLVVHSGSVGYDSHKAFRSLLGGVFVSHPEQTSVTVELNSQHFLVSHHCSFHGKDEHYVMDMETETKGQERKREMLLSTSSKDGVNLPGGWTREEGKGRVCVLTPGHNVEIWLEPTYQHLLRAALQWCAGAKVDQL